MILAPKRAGVLRWPMSIGRRASFLVWAEGLTGLGASATQISKCRPALLWELRGDVLHRLQRCRVDRKLMDNAVGRSCFAQRCAEGKDCDIMFYRSAPSDAPLLVAGDARLRIEDGAQSVAAGRERIAGRPLVEKEIASGLRCLDVGFRSSVIPQQPAGCPVSQGDHNTQQPDPAQRAPKSSHDLASPDKRFLKPSVS